MSVRAAQPTGRCLPIPERGRRRPTKDDVVRAARAIAPYVVRTGFHESADLSRVIGARAFVKFENQQPIGSFKVRGAVARLLEMSPLERSRGVVTASEGNHGQGVAYAARIVGAPATVVAPEGANPDRVAAIRNLGAEVEFNGADFEAALRHAWHRSIERCLTYVHPGNDPTIIAGYATVALEMFEDEPDLDAIFVPVGGGSLASGVALVAKSMRPSCRVVGVQSSSLPGFVASLALDRRAEVPPLTSFSEGITVRKPSLLPFEMVRDLVDDVVAVGEDEIRRAVILLVEHTRNVPEGAGAASLAGALRLGGIGGKRVGIILSGGNIQGETPTEVLTESSGSRCSP